MATYFQMVQNQNYKEREKERGRIVEEKEEERRGRERGRKINGAERNYVLGTILTAFL